MKKGYTCDVNSENSNLKEFQILAVESPTGVSTKFSFLPEEFQIQAKVSWSFFQFKLQEMK